MIDQPTDIKLRGYKSLANKSIVNEYIPIETIANESTVTESTVPKKCLLIIDDHSSHFSVKFFQFAEDHVIGLGFLPPHTTRLLQPLDVSFI